MSIPTLVTGDDFILPVNLTVNGAAHAVNLSATVTAAIVSADHADVLLAAVTQSSGSPGANWATGTVAVVFTPAQTAAILETGTALIEIQVSDTTKDSWFTPVRIIKGNIA